MNGQILVVGTVVLTGIILMVIFLHLVKGKENKKYTKVAKELEIERNKIISTPVLLELSKMEPLLKNHQLEDKYNMWKERFAEIKEKNIAVIDDILIDLDLYIERKNYKKCAKIIADAELEIYKSREKAEHLLEEVREITLSEEKYRSIVTKLKNRYRKENNTYQSHKEMYDDIEGAIDLQLENIEKNFLDFEKVMEKNEYGEVVKIVKALDTMIDHISIVIEEVPDLLLMAKELIPKRMKEVKDMAKQMKKENYAIEYLNIDYNIKEAKKNIGNILDKIKILNLEDCMFELKTMLEYLDSLFVDFEKERLSRKVFEETKEGFDSKLQKTNSIVHDLYLQLEDIKNIYDLQEEELASLTEVKKSLVSINDDYNNLVKKVDSISTPYSILHKEIDELLERLTKTEEELDVCMKSLGNMHDDEERAREQLEEIEKFLQESKNKMRSYKLPIITDKYYIELKEANDAIKEVIKELEKQPIVISTLNTRVDTARDLVLKLYNTTNEMVKTAVLAEKCIVYSNRYRPYYDELNEGIEKAENYFYRGRYKEALDTVLKSCVIVDNDIYKKMLSLYDN